MPFDEARIYLTGQGRERQAREGKRGGARPANGALYRRPGPSFRSAGGAKPRPGVSDVVQPHGPLRKVDPTRDSAVTGWTASSGRGEPAKSVAGPPALMGIASRAESRGSAGGAASDRGDFRRKRRLRPPTRPDPTRADPTRAHPARRVGGRNPPLTKARDGGWIPGRWTRPSYRPISPGSDATTRRSSRRGRGPPGSSPSEWRSGGAPTRPGRAPRPGA